MSSSNSYEATSQAHDIPAQKEVILLCYDGATTSNLEKIRQAVETKTSKFSLRVYNKHVKTAPKSWRAIRDLLREHATWLSITCNQDMTGPGIYSFLVGPPWPNLRELHLSTDASFTDQEEYNSLLEAVKAVENKTFEPPFPSLKVWRVATHPNSHPARWACDMAPNLELFELDTRGYRKDPVPTWDMHRNNVIHSGFLTSEKYRTIVTSAKMRVYIKPGPKHIHPYNRLLALESLSTHTPDYGVLISEMRGGTRFERRLTFKEFEKTEDLSMVDLAESKP